MTDIHEIIEEKIEQLQEKHLRLINQRKKITKQEENILLTENIVRNMQKYLEILMESYNIVKNTLLLKKSSYQCEVNLTNKKIEVLTALLSIKKELLEREDITSIINNIVNENITFYDKTNDKNIETKTKEFVILIETFNSLFNHPIIVSTDITSNYYQEMLLMKTKLENYQRISADIGDEILIIKQQFSDLIDQSSLGIKKSGNVDLSNIIDKINIEDLKFSNNEVQKLCMEFNFTSRKESKESSQIFELSNVSKRVYSDVKQSNINSSHNKVTAFSSELNNNLSSSISNIVISEKKFKPDNKNSYVNEIGRIEEQSVENNICSEEPENKVKCSKNIQNEITDKTKKVSTIITSSTNYTLLEQQHQKETNIDLINDLINEVSNKIQVVKNQEEENLNKSNKNDEFAASRKPSNITNNNSLLNKKSNLNNSNVSFNNNIVSFHKHESRYNYDHVQNTPPNNKIRMGHFISYSNNFEDNNSDLTNLELKENITDISESAKSHFSSKFSQNVGSLNQKTSKKKVSNFLEEIDYHNFKHSKDFSCLIRKNSIEEKKDSCDHNYNISLNKDTISKYEKYLKEKLEKPFKTIKDKNFLKKVLIPIRNIHLLEYDDLGKLNLKGVNYKNVSIDFKINFSYANEINQDKDSSKLLNNKLDKSIKSLFDSYSKYFTSVCFNIVVIKMIEDTKTHELWCISIGGKIKGTIEEFYENLNSEVKSSIIDDISVIEEESVNITIEICNFNFSEDAFLSAFQKEKEMKEYQDNKGIFLFKRLFIIDTKGFKNKIVFLKKCREILKNKGNN